MSSKVKLFIIAVQGGYIKNFISLLCKNTNFEITYSVSAADAIIIVVPPMIKCDADIELECLNYKKPIFVFDFSEYGVSRLREKNYLDNFVSNSLLGFNVDKILNEINSNRCLSNINNFLQKNISNMRIYFLRELSKNLFDNNDLPFSLEPLDYILNTSSINDKALSKEQFFLKNIDICFVWGKTNSDRMSLHGALMQHFSRTDLYHHVISSCEQYEEYIQRKQKNTSGILLMNKNGYAKERIDLSPILLNSKLCIDLYGNGMKCFRNPESSIYSISIKQDCTKLKFAFDWYNNQNCFMLPNETTHNSIDIQESVKVIETILADLKNKDKIYDIYVNSFNTATKYIGKNYIDYFVATKILEKL